jgi:hypothetical protein
VTHSFHKSRSCSSFSMYEGTHPRCSLSLIQVVKTLMRTGSNIDKQTRTGARAAAAAARVHALRVTLLFAVGQSCLHLAYKNGHTELCAYLLAHTAGS